MKKTLLMLLCATSLVLGAAAANAKDKDFEKGPRRPGIEKMHENLGKKLNLTAEQETKAKALREDGHKKMKPLIEEMKNTKTKMDELRKENMKAFEEILTPEQKTEFEKFKAEKKQDRDGKGKKGKFSKKGKHNGHKHKGSKFLDAPKAAE